MSGRQARVVHRLAGRSVTRLIDELGDEELQWELVAMRLASLAVSFSRGSIRDQWRDQPASEASWRK